MLLFEWKFIRLARCIVNNATTMGRGAGDGGGSEGSEAEKERKEGRVDEIES